MSWRIPAVAALVSVLAAGAGWIPAGAATSTTTCAFGGPAGTSRVVRLDLPNGSDLLDLRLTSTRVQRPVAGAESWHLGQAVVVLDEASGAVVSYRVSNSGTNPRRVAAEGDGVPRTTLAAPGPDAPFVHAGALPVAGLGPGTYLVVAFGSDGSSDPPQDSWGGSVTVAGSVPCTILEQSTELLDVNHTDFTGGTQVSTPAAVSVDGSSYVHDFDRSLVVGFIDAGYQGAGDARVDFEHPGGVTGSVVRSITPFVSPSGLFRWTATLHGPAALASVVAVAIDR